METFWFFTAIVIGGTGNMLGGAIGVALVPIVFQEATRFFPNIGYPGLSAALQWVVIGVLILVFLWFRPQGLVPERRRTFHKEKRFSRQPTLPVEVSNADLTNER
jgi:branched-chain amino acid transport system permease protein